MIQNYHDSVRKWNKALTALRIERVFALIGCRPSYYLKVWYVDYVGGRCGYCWEFMKASAKIESDCGSCPLYKQEVCANRPSGPLSGADRPESYTYWKLYYAVEHGSYGDVLKYCKEIRQAVIANKDSFAEDKVNDTVA